MWDAGTARRRLTRCPGHCPRPVPKLLPNFVPSFCGYNEVPAVGDSEQGCRGCEGSAAPPGFCSFGSLWWEAGPRTVCTRQGRRAAACSPGSQPSPEREELTSPSTLLCPKRPPNSPPQQISARVWQWGGTPPLSHTSGRGGLG